MEDVARPGRHSTLALERDALERDGFVLVPGVLSAGTLEHLLAVTHQECSGGHGPVEYEADLGYPGAPTDRTVEGGGTIRRLLQVYDRDAAFRACAHEESVISRLRAFLSEDLVLSLAHHNCVMTKEPAYSSDTPWHQDCRYWRFRRPELISILFALTDATVANGCMRFVPGSHRLILGPERLDEALALREKLPENQEVLTAAVELPMKAGDALFFHCRTLHAARRNESAATRVSLIFTYRAADNPPVPGTRSARGGEVVLGRDDSGEEPVTS